MLAIKFIAQRRCLIYYTLTFTPSSTNLQFVCEMHCPW